MKVYTVIEYITVAREFYDIRAKDRGEAIDKVMNDPTREPDHERTIISGDWEAEEQDSLSSSFKRKE